MLIPLLLVMLALALFLLLALALLPVYSETFRARVAPMKLRRSAALALCLAMGSAFMLVVLSLAACTKQQASTGVSWIKAIGDSTCEILGEELQNEPDYVKVGCQAIDPATQVAQQVIFKMKRADAVKFAGQHCAPIPTKGGAPTP